MTSDLPTREEWDTARELLIVFTSGLASGRFIDVEAPIPDEVVEAAAEWSRCGEGHFGTVESTRAALRAALAKWREMGNG